MMNYLLSCATVLLVTHYKVSVVGASNGIENLRMQGFECRNKESKVLHNILTMELTILGYLI